MVLWGEYCRKGPITQETLQVNAIVKKVWLCVDRCMVICGILVWDVVEMDKCEHPV